MKTIVACLLIVLACSENVPCKPGEFYFEGWCYNWCPRGSYYDWKTQTNECFKCHPACE